MRLRRNIECRVEDSKMVKCKNIANEEPSQLPVATFQSGGDYTDGDEVNGTISAGITGSVDNGL